MTGAIDVLRDSLSHVGTACGCGAYHGPDCPKRLPHYAALADLDALVQAASEITYAIWESEPEEIASAERFRAALGRVKGEQT